NRCHLCEPADPAGARQTHLGESTPRGRAGLQRVRSGRLQVRLPAALLAGGAPRLAARPDRRGAQYRFHDASSDPVHPRGVARRAECVILFRQRPRPPSRENPTARRGAGAAQIGLTPSPLLGAGLARRHAETSEPIPCPSLRAKRSNPGAAVRPSGLLAPRMLWPLDCLVARAPRNDGWVAADPINLVVIGRRLRNAWVGSLSLAMTA